MGRQPDVIAFRTVAGALEGYKPAPVTVADKDLFQIASGRGASGLTAPTLRASARRAGSISLQQVVERIYLNARTACSSYAVVKITWGTSSINQHIEAGTSRHLDVRNSTRGQRFHHFYRPAELPASPTISTQRGNRINRRRNSRRAGASSSSDHCLLWITAQARCVAASIQDRTLAE